MAQSGAPSRTGGGKIRGVRAMLCIVKGVTGYQPRHRPEHCICLGRGHEAEVESLVREVPGVAPERCLVGEDSRADPVPGFLSRESAVLKPFDYVRHEAPSLRLSRAEPEVLKLLRMARDDVCLTPFLRTFGGEPDLDKVIEVVPVPRFAVGPTLCVVAKVEEGRSSHEIPMGSQRGEQYRPGQDGGQL